MQNSSAKTQLSINENLSNVKRNRSITNYESISNLNLKSEQNSQDIFDIGLILLHCALGGFELYDTNNFFASDSIKQVLDKVQSNKGISGYCCLLHDEDVLRRFSAANNTSANSIYAKKQPLTNNFSVKLPHSILETSRISQSLYQILQKQERYSTNFLDLLCSCLKIDPFQRSDAKTLLNHEFFSDNHINLGPKIYLSEIMNIYNSNFSSKLMDNNNQGNGNINNFSNIQVDRFLEGLKMVFMSGDIKGKFDKMLIKTGTKEIKNRKIIDLAIELEYDPVKLWNIIRQEIIDK